MSRLVLIDNYDSFTWNLVQAFQVLGARVEVVLHDRVDCVDIAALEPDRLVISPGPGTPADAGISCDAIRRFAGEIPILGVCLGHQCIAEVYGGRVKCAASPMHGKTSRLRHDRMGLFEGLAQEIEVMRYHSLIVEDLPDELIACAWTDEGEVMALRHATLPIYGVQFHPESILSPEGPAMLAHFLGL